MRTLTALLLLSSMLVGCPTPSQNLMDEEVKRLCAIDGGIKVYETVKLPPSAFDEFGMVRLYPEQKDENPEPLIHNDKFAVNEYVLGSEYLVRHEFRYLKGDERHYDDPSILRSNFQILRRVGRKLLGEGIGYDRRGGDAPSSGPTVFSCPENKTIGDILSHIFIKSDTKD